MGRVSFTSGGTAGVHVVLGLMELPECTRTRWNKWVEIIVAIIAVKPYDRSAANREFSDHQSA